MEDSNVTSDEAFVTVENAFVTVENALKGNFVLLKPKQCQPPDDFIGDETYIEGTDDLNESAFGNDSDIEGYNTAPSGYDDSDTATSNICSLIIQTDHFTPNATIGEESHIKEFTQDNKTQKEISTNHNYVTGKESGFDDTGEVNTLSPIPVPERTATDQFIFRNQQGKLKRFHSSLHWAQAATYANRYTCWDCAAQVSTRDLSSTEENGESITVNKSNSLAIQTTLKDCEHIGFYEKSIEPNSHRKSCLSSNHATTINQCLSSTCVSNEVSKSLNILS